jgi:hypothetical protein
MITRLIRPSIELQKIDIKYNDDVQDGNANDFVSRIGLYPFVIINGLILEYRYFVNFVLKNDQFLPKLEMKFKDLSNKMIDELFPLDDTTISIFIKSPSENLMPVRMDFKVTEFNPVKNDVNNEETIYSLEGILNVNGLYNSPYWSKQDTSFNVLKELANMTGLGFATNIQSTDDKMIWINPADINLDFIKMVTMSSYKDDESFLWSYVDFYYNLTYVDIETQFNDTTEGLEGVNSNKYLLDNAENTTPLFLTNHPDSYGSSLFISKYNIVNSSTKTNLEIGYNYFIKYYNTIEKNLSGLLLDTISSSGDNGDIVLKANNEKGNNSDSLYNTNWNGDFLGKVDIDNMHKNFYYSLIQNERNMKYFQKIKMKVILTTPNFNLYRFQMIKVKLYKMQELDSKTRTTPPENRSALANKNIYEDKLNKRLSGNWMISGINYTFSIDGGWQQEINLVRRELGDSKLKLK